jgi:hypothetical protein
MNLGRKEKNFILQCLHFCCHSLVVILFVFHGKFLDDLYQFLCGLIHELALYGISGLRLIKI